MLWKTIRDILQIAGYDVATIEQELILYDNKDGRKAEPPSGMAGYASSIRQSEVAELDNQSAIFE